jgi:lysozyme
MKFFIIGNPMNGKTYILSLWIALGFPILGFSQTTEDYRNELQKWEGYRNTPYHDAGGHSVGIGHHLYGPIKRVYSDREIQVFFDRDLENALHACREYIENFDTLPVEVKQVCVGLVWTVGENGFYKFIRFRHDISTRDYYEAANELIDSRWYHQVSRQRSEHYINILRHQ